MGDSSCRGVGKHMAVGSKPTHPLVLLLSHTEMYFIRPPPPRTSHNRVPPSLILSPPWPLPNVVSLWTTVRARKQRLGAAALALGHKNFAKGDTAWTAS
jgi:hypothetical protein